MIDEQALRRPDFVEGTRIRLANGHDWSFPDQPPHPEDHELIAILQAIAEAEDEPERLRGELALAILLLSRNYDLSPGDFQAILSFAPGDPTLIEMQRAVHELASRHSRDLQYLSRPKSNSPPLPVAHWRLANLFKLRNRAKSNRSS
jgi:hypothetical protein